MGATTATAIDYIYAYLYGGVYMD